MLFVVGFVYAVGILTDVRYVFIHKQDRQCTYNLRLIRVRITFCCRGKAIIIKHYVHVSVFLS